MVQSLRKEIPLAKFFSQRIGQVLSFYRLKVNSPKNDGGRINFNQNMDFYHNLSSLYLLDKLFAWKIIKASDYLDLKSRSRSRDYRFRVNNFQSRYKIMKTLDAIRVSANCSRWKKSSLEEILSRRLVGHRERGRL